MSVTKEEFNDFIKQNFPNLFDCKEDEDFTRYISSIEVLRLAHEIEKSFKVNLSHKAISAKEFNTISKIFKIINNLE